ncbi:GlxA family transcriptional regulator [Mycobacterium sp. ZZG]
MNIPADTRSRHIAVLVFDGVRTLDLTGPLEVFDVAQVLGCRYSVRLYSTSGTAAIRCGSGLSIHAATSPLPPDVDTVLVPGGDCLVTGGVPAHLDQAVRSLAPAARRTASICAGSFALGAAGVLDGRRATTHWRHLEVFAARHPSTAIERDSVYTRDGNVWTSAGGTAAIDLALALVADDFGNAVAQDICKEMVLLGRRLEGHPQISAAARTARPKHPGLDRLMATIVVDPAGHYELDVVAAQLGLSPRHLARLFKAQVGVTLREYVDGIRLENAVGLVLAGESFHAAARRSGLRSGARVRDHLVARRTPA